MMGSTFKSMEVVVGCSSHEQGGGLEEGGSKAGRTGGRRMTGSAFKAMDVVVACVFYEMGGGLEEGELKIGPQRRAADDGKRF